MTSALWPAHHSGEWGNALDEAINQLHRGAVVVLPTDTVYGIGADAFNPSAVNALLRAKGRGRHMPPPVLVASPATIDALATHVPEGARALAERFWPGGLTLICHAQPSLAWDLGRPRERLRCASLIIRQRWRCYSARGRLQCRLRTGPAVKQR